MTIDSAPASASPDSPREARIGSAAPPSWPWRRAGVFLAGAAQLITISALVGADPVAVTWSSLLLAIAPALLAAGAAFAPAPVNLVAAVAGVGVLVAGVIGQVTHTGLFFVPALVVLAVAAVKLWREQGLTAAEGAGR